jgi:hypothetical protein
MREYIRQAMLDMVRRRYGALFEELKLTPEQTEQFTQLISAEFQKGAQKLAASPGTIPPEAVQSADKRPELEEELKSLLGEKGMARFTEYSQEIPARTTVDLLNAQLGAGKLTDEQRARLFELVKAEPFELTHGIAGDLDKAFFGSQTEIDGYVEKIAESNQRVLQQAGNFLGADQLTALNTVLTNGITARLTQAAAFNQKH